MHIVRGSGSRAAKWEPPAAAAGLLKRCVPIFA